MPTAATRTSEKLAKNRRIYPRRRGHFPATYVFPGSAPQPAFGLDISGGGLCLLTQTEIPKEFLGMLTLVAMIETRQVNFEAGGRWVDTVQSRGSTQYRYGLRMKSIADGDWNFVMAHSVDEGVKTGEVLSTAQRDALIPIEKQRRVAEALHHHKRLHRPPGAAAPLIEYRFEGYEMRSGTAYYRLNVRTRVVDRDGPRDIRTPVLAGIESDAVKVLVD